MKKKRINKKFVALALASLMLVGTVAACGGQPAAEQDTFVVGEKMDLAMEMVPLSEGPPAMFTVLMPSAPGTAVSKNAKAEIDYSNAKDGYVMIKFLQVTSVRLAVRITGPDSVSYTYNLRGDGQYEVFPLANGNGRYTVGVFEHVQGTTFATANSASFDVALTDEFAPFLRPNQIVNFSSSSKVVAKAAELVKDIDDLTEKIAVVYNFVVKNISYDRELAQSVQTGYIPDIDAVLEKGKGICFDYSAVMAAMLRSQMVPTRLVMGYAGTTYHAWIDVYSEETGWINSVIFFDGDNWVLMDPTFASGSQNAGSFIGDGKNYSVKHLF